MGFPQIGLEQVLQDKGFNAAVDKYMSAMDRMMGKTTQAGSQMESGMNRASGGIAGFFKQSMAFAAGQAIWGGIQKIGQAVAGLASEAWGAVASYERLGMSLQTLYARELKTASGGTLSMADALGQAAGKSQDLLDWIEQVGIKSPFSSEGVAQAFRTAMAYGFTADEAKRLTQANIDYAAGSGSSSEVMNQIALALGQIKAKGTLAGQEMLQLTGAGLNVRQILADAFGVSTAAIVEMQEKGLIPANKAIEAIVSSLESDFGGSAERAATGLEGLSESLKELKTIGLREFFTGTFQAIQPYLSKFVDLMGSPAVRDTLNKWGAALGGAVVTGLQNLQGLIATVTPILTKFVAILKTPADWGANFKTLTSTVLPSLANNLETLATKMFAWVTTNLPLWLTKLSEFGKAAASWILDALPVLLSNLMTWKEKLIGFLMANLPVWVGELVKFGIAAVSWIADQLPALARNLEAMLGRMLKWVTDSLPSWIKSLQELGLKAVDWVLDALPGLAANLGRFLGDLLKWIAKTVIDVVPKLAELAFKFLGWIVTDVIPKLPEFLGKILITILSFIGGMISSVSPELAKFATDMVGKLSSTITEKAGEMVQAGKDLLQGFWNGITEKWEDIKAWIAEKVALLPSWITGPLQMESPSKVMAEIGKDFIEGFLVGMDEKKIELYKDVVDIFGGIVSIIEDWPAALAGLMEMKGFNIGTLQAKAQQMAEGINTIIVELMHAAWAFTDASGDWRNIPKAAAEFAGWVSTAMGAIGSAADAITKIVEGKPVSAARVDQFLGNLQYILVQFYDKFGTRADDYFKTIAEWSPNVQVAMDMLGGAASAITAVVDGKQVTAKRVDTFLGNLWYILDRFEQKFGAKGKDWFSIIAEWSPNVQVAMSLLGNAASAITSVMEGKQVSAKRVDQFLNNLWYILDRMVQKFGDFGKGWFSIIAEWSPNVEKAMGMLGSASGAISAIVEGKQVTAVRVDTFLNNLWYVLTKFAAKFGEIGLGWFSVIAEWSGNAEKAMALLGNAAGVITQITEGKQVTARRVDTFLNNLWYVLTKFAAKFGKIGPGWFGIIAKWTENAEKAMSLLGNAAGVITSIVEGKQVSAARVDRFLNNLWYVLTEFAKKFGTIGKGWYGVIAEWAPNAEKAVALLSSAVDALEGMATGLLPSLPKIDAFVDKLFETLQRFADKFSEKAKDYLTKEGGIAENASKIMGAMSAALDAFDKLAEFEGGKWITPQKIDTLIDMMKYAIDSIIWLAYQINPAWVEVASAFASRCGGIFDAMKSALDFLASLAKEAVPSKDKIAEFVKTLREIYELFQQGSEYSNDTRDQTDIMAGNFGDIAGQMVTIGNDIYNAAVSSVSALQNAWVLAENMRRMPSGLDSGSTSTGSSGLDSGSSSTGSGGFSNDQTGQGDTGGKDSNRLIPEDLPKRPSRKDPFEEQERRPTYGGGGGGGGGTIEGFAQDALGQLFDTLARAVTVPIVIAMESWAYPEMYGGGRAGDNLNLTIYSQARAENLLSDFEMLRAMA